MEPWRYPLFNGNTAMWLIVQHSGVLHTVADEAVSMSSASSMASIAAT